MRCSGQACVLARLSSSEYKRILKRFQERQIAARLKFFASFSLFKGWKPEDVSVCIIGLKYELFPAGAVSYKAGEPAETVFFVIRGEVSVGLELEFARQTKESATEKNVAMFGKAKRSSAADSKVHSLELSLVGRHGSLGDVEAVHGCPKYVLSAVCKTDCKLGTITRIVLNRRMRRVGSAILSVMHDQTTDKFDWYQQRLYELAREIERRFKRVPSTPAEVELPILPSRAKHAQKETAKADSLESVRAWATGGIKPVSAPAPAQPAAPKPRQQRGKPEASAEPESDAIARELHLGEAAPSSASGGGRAAYLSTKLPKRNEQYLMRHTMPDSCVTAYTPILRPTSSAVYQGEQPRYILEMVADLTARPALQRAHATPTESCAWAFDFKDMKSSQRMLSRIAPEQRLRRLAQRSVAKSAWDEDAASSARHSEVEQLKHIRRLLNTHLRPVADSNPQGTAVEDCRSN